MYKVIKKFIDLQDDNHVYEVEDEYPRLGYDASLIRINELLSDFNLQKTPLIEEVIDIDIEENEKDDELLEDVPKKKTRKRKKN